jgi:hypothetical protein
VSFVEMPVERLAQVGPLLVQSVQRFGLVGTPPPLIGVDGEPMKVPGVALGEFFGLTAVG